MATQSSSVVSTNGEDLWIKAFDSLDPDLRSSLGQTTTDKCDILAAVLDAAKNLKTISLRKRWIFKRSNGQEVVIRDVLEKITKWVDRFKAVGDAAVQFDPDRAAIPWAAVRFLLQALVNDFERYAAMVQALEVVSRIITRYKEFENLYLGRQQPTQPALDGALTVLYSEVLVFLARTITFFSKSTTGIAVWTGDDSVQIILSREDEVLKLAKLQDTSDLRFIETTVLRMKDQINHNTKRIEEEDSIQMISWLSNAPISIHHDTISQSRTPDFGQWLLRDVEYRDWCQSSSSSALWIHGITGSGKTHLFSVVVDSLLADRSANKALSPFAYFYCLNNDSEPERSSVDGILRSILRQLTITESQNDVRDFLYSDFQRRSRLADKRGLELPKLNRKECVARILQVADEDPITILLDSVDQVEEEYCTILLDSLFAIMSKAANVVKVLVTSRNSLDILPFIPVLKEITVSAERTRDDMSRFIAYKIDEAKLISGRLSSKTRDHLQKALLDGAGEMFLWAHRQIQQLRKIRIEDDLLPALQSSILSDLDQLYDIDLQQILRSGDTSRRLAIQIFSWLLYMKAPLTPDALLAAILASSIKISSCTVADISALCSNLVVVDTKSQVVRIAHQSIRDYLLRTRQSLFSAPVSNTLLASTCINANALGSPSGVDLKMYMRHFYVYAAMYWASHFQCSGVVDAKQELFQEMSLFIFGDEGHDVSLSFEAWLNICKNIASVLPIDHAMKTVLDAIPNERSSPLFLAAIFGFDGLLSLLAEPEMETDWNQRNNLGHSAVYLAASSGHISTVTALIRQGAVLNVECGGYGSPLYVSCFRGYHEIVIQLLESGASPKCGTKFKSAVHAAIYGGHEDIVVTLVQHSRTITSEQDYQEVVLMATEYGLIKVINELKKPTFKSFIVKETPDQHMMKLARAIRGGQLGVLKSQLSKEGPKASEVFPVDAVAIASLYGHRDVVEFLLEQGLDIEAEGQFGTPLRSASLMNHRATVELLVQSGANTRTNEKKGNPLCVAAIKGHEDIVRILLHEGVDPTKNTPTGSFGSVLEAAAYFGHRNIVETLLDHRMSVPRVLELKNAFHAAAEGGRHEVIMLFLDRGYQFNKPPISMGGARGLRNRCRGVDYSGYSRDVNRGRKTEVIKDLEEMHINEDATVVETGDYLEDFFEGLYDQRRACPPPRRVNWHRSVSRHYALEISAACGRETVIKVLLAQKKAAQVSEDDIHVALDEAVYNGHLGAFQHLLEDISTKSSFLRYFDNHFRKAAQAQQEKLIECALTRALKIGYTKEEVDELRLRLPRGRERYKAVSITHDLLRSDFLASCQSGSVSELEDILQYKHEHLLQETDLLDGVQIAVKNGGAPFLKALFKYRSELEELAIPSQALVSAAGKDLETSKLLFLRRENFPYSLHLLGQMMHSACRNGQPEVIEYLVSDFGVDVNTNILEDITDRVEDFESIMDVSGRDNDSSETSQGVRFISPLQVALACFQSLGNTSRKTSNPEVSENECFSGHEKVVQTLLNLGANPNSLGGKADYPLKYALRFCSATVVKILIGAGADIRLASKDDSALVIAIQRERDAMSVTSSVLDAGYPLPDYCEQGKTFIETLLNSLVTYNKRPFYPDKEYHRYSHFHTLTVERIFDHGPGAVLELLLQKYDTGKLDDMRYTLTLQMACYVGKASFVDLLLARGVDANATTYLNGSAVEVAALAGHTSIVGRLLHAGADINNNQGKRETPLRAATFGGHCEVVQLLLQHSAILREQLSTGSRDAASPSLLQLAVKKGYTDIVKTFLAADSTITSHGDCLQPPLIMACQKGDIAMVELFLQAGAHVNIHGRKDGNPFIWSDNGSPLHAAILGGHIGLVEKLLSRGADVNFYVDECLLKTPLLAAFYQGDPKIIRKHYDGSRVKTWMPN
ncbi:hypothetical protein FPSE5266_10074 [Fusarium pseudograminearum]|nr:hypothetical protein FPSE5266_10074 [Fusarium pseudograminearum]